jgi:hypothetical protein
MVARVLNSKLAVNGRTEADQWDQPEKSVMYVNDDERKSGNLKGLSSEI